jgi:ribosomal protein S18 acetylase RimI-like enzyme
MSDFITLYRQAADYFFRGISLKTMDFSDEATAYMTGAPVGDLNPVFVRRDALSFEEILTASESFYGSLSYTIVIPENFLEYQRILKSKGYAQTSESHCMMLDLDLFQKEIILEDELKIVSTDENLSDWMTPLIDAFECTVEIMSPYVSAHAKALQQKASLQHFTLYKNADPVASITLSLHNHLARIDDLGTLPKYQRKGYATHLLLYVLEKAKKKGAKYCFLESSDLGFSLYERYGLKTLFKNQIYALLKD